MHGLFRVRGFTQARAFSSWSVDVVWHMAMQASGESWEGMSCTELLWFFVVMWFHLFAPPWLLVAVYMPTSAGAVCC